MTSALSPDIPATECLFCKIIDRSIPAPLLLETEHAVAFADINPQAPHHYLVIPKKHVKDLLACTDTETLEHLMSAVNQLAHQQGLTTFRTVINTGSDAGQTVFHLHVHLLAGRIFDWPPG